MEPDQRKGGNAEIQGFDYLYRRGNRYVVRMQVPLALQSTVGRRELKKSLGADFGAARNDIHRVIADFQDQLERARSPASPEISVPAVIDEHAIDIAVYARFRRMTLDMRGKVAEPVGESPNAREARIAGFQTIVDLSLNALDRDDWEAASTDAGWLREEQGWSFDQTQPLFRYLCFRMLRARLECYRQDIRRLKGNFSERADGDASFGPAPPSRDMLLNSKPSRYWVPLIGPFTGARRGEICGLRVDEIVQHDGAWIIELRNRPDRKIKARKSRVIPVHSTLKQMGLIDFVEHQKRRNRSSFFRRKRPIRSGCGVMRCLTGSAD